MSEFRPVDPAQPDDDAAWEDLVRRFHEPDADVERSPRTDEHGREIEETGRPPGRKPDAETGRGLEGERGLPPGRRLGADTGTDHAPDARPSDAPPSDVRPSDDPFVPPDLLAGNRGWTWPRQVPADTSGPRDHVVDEPDERFEPPEPEPISSAEPALVLAWSGVGVAIGALLLITVFFRSAPILLSWALVGLFLLSAGYLVFRLPRERHDDDDGAQV